VLYELRTYRLKTGTVPHYLKLVEEEGIAIQRSHLGHLAGYFATDIGPLNEIVHIWLSTAWLTGSAVVRPCCWTRTGSLSFPKSRL